MLVSGSHRDDKEALLAANSAGTSAGLYASEFEHDACGVAFVATLPGARPGR
jgi:hypothetical protein